MRYKYISKVNGPVVVSKGEADFAMHEVVLVGKLKPP